MPFYKENYDKMAYKKIIDEISYELLIEISS